jgi:hypothetical protein
MASGVSILTDAEALAPAARLVADLMPIAIIVGGDDPAMLVGAFEAAGASAEILAAGSTGPFDLAVLRADPAAFATAPVQTCLKRLMELSDRVVFRPLPGPSGVDLDALTAWFEHFADMGYQPVVEYDASYFGDGAFLVDRNATAAETDLAGFAERISQGGALHASTMRVAELEAELSSMRAEHTALSARAAALPGAQAEIAALRESLHAAEARVGALAEEVAAWSPLRDWVRAAVARAPLPAARHRGFLARMFGRRRQPANDTARIRGTRLFDAAWYIACHPELAETGEDPALHYLLTGARAGYDPGPWFDSAKYMRENPGLDPSATNPLLHAIESGREAALIRQAGIL